MENPRWRWVAVPALALVAWMLALRWLSPPAALPADAPDTAFSGTRAKAALSRVLGDERPHPVGTSANRAVERRIREALALMDLTVDVETDVICAEHCAETRNLLAVVPGTGPALQPVLVSTHYDSVRSGPGAGDAGAGVGTLLELARLLQVAPRARTVHLLFNEGEEAGLLGAQTYLRQARDVGAVINLEARGTHGNAFLFELKGSAVGWTQRLKGHGRSPSVSSLYTAIYDLLPNNTDATVYGHTLPVANVAFLGGGIRYHTPLDDLAHLDVGSVQHLGDQALGLLDALDEGDLDDLQGEHPAVFWDVGGWFILTCTQPVFRGMVAALFLFHVGVVVARRRTLSWRRAGWAALAFPAWVGLSALWGWGAQTLVPTGWFGMPALPLFALLAGVVGIGLGLSPLCTRAGEAMLWHGAGLSLAGLSLLAAVFLPQASYLFAQPALALGVVTLLPGAFRGRSIVLGGLSLLAILPVVHVAAGLVPALGLIGPVVTGAFALALWPLLAFSRDVPKPAIGAVVGASVVLAASTVFLPEEARDRPHGLRVTHLTVGDRAWLYATPARFPWPTETAPWSLPEAVGPRPLRRGRFVFDGSPSTSAPPRFDVLGKQGGRVRVRVHAPGAEGLFIRGGRPSRGQATADPFHWLGEAHGLELEIDEGDVWAAAIYPGLPDSVPELPPHTVPIHTGFETWSGLTTRITD